MVFGWLDHAPECWPSALACGAVRRCFSRLTCLCLAGNDLMAGMCRLVLPSTPQSQLLDVSCSEDVEVGESGLSAELLQWCGSLRDVYLEPRDRLSAASGHAILELQRQLPRVRFHLADAPSRMYIKR